MADLPPQKNIPKCEKFWLQVLSWTIKFPPGLDGLQPKSPASPGGNKLSIQTETCLQI